MEQDRYQFFEKDHPLQKEVEAKMALLQQVENDIPAVIIIHNIRTSVVVYMSQMGLDILGVTLSELQALGTEYHARFFNPDDAKDYVPKILGFLERNNDDEMISYFQQVRRSPQHDWQWYLSATKIFCRDEQGKPLLTITTATPVDAQHHMAAKAQRLLAENNFLRRNSHLYQRLTKREREILRLMAMGESSTQIAKHLHIAEATALTHRKNIRNKLEAKNNYDIARFAQAYDLI